MHLFTEYVNPYLGDLIEKVNMDKVYVRGEGCYLYDSTGKRYLDFIAAYGALPFGFNPAEIWNAVLAVHDSKEPSFIQPSALSAAGELAKRLIKLAPPNIRYVTFTNSGAESVEAAIKLSRSATGRRGILATHNSFHGKTLGALSATGKTSYQQVFGAPVEGFDFIEYDDITALECQLRENPEKYAAFIVEPIQGEGGIIVPKPGYLLQVQECCKRYGVCFIVDEIQTGLGRTGRMFACEEEGVTPDIITIAKALGGGLVPIGACLASEEVYNEEFAMKHSSTFAGNTLACRVGIAVCDILTKDNRHLLENVAQCGAYLKSSLQELKDKYPEIIRDVRGKGLMIGIEYGITRDTFRDTNLLELMADQEMLTPLVSSYLLNVEGLRVAPTLNGASTIRIEPSLIVTESQCEYAISALQKVTQVLAECNTAKFLGHLVGNPEISKSGSCLGAPEKQAVPSEDPAEGRFAFLVHPLDLENYSDFDASLSAFSHDELKSLTSKWNTLVEPFVIAQTRIVSTAGASAYGEFVVVPRTAEELMELPRKEAFELVKAAVDLAAQRGARIVGLGAYTSIITNGGRSFAEYPVAVTTGNSYTVVSAVEAILEALQKLNVKMEHTSAAVVGATGAIGRCIAFLLAQEVKSLILIGNPQNAAASERRLLRIAAEIYRHLVTQKDKVTESGNTLLKMLQQVPHLPSCDVPMEEFVEFAERMSKEGRFIIISTDVASMLPKADVVVTATSSVNKFITSDILKFGAVVCDMSRPLNISHEVRTSRPDVLVIDGGVIEVPGRPWFGWNFGFERGLSYACMAETFMLALEHIYEDTSIGSDLSLETTDQIRELAAKHGFKLAGLRSFDRPLTQEEWSRVCEAREAQHLKESVI
jgi:acetylornithine/succinyldiaminopimelate/putrescine aminotransferase/predicted amino acid dehydrogenase